MTSNLRLYLTPFVYLKTKATSLETKCPSIENAFTRGAGGRVGTGIEHGVCTLDRGDFLFDSKHTNADQGLGESHSGDPVFNPPSCQRPFLHP